jgi:hypothetical protein
MFAPFFRGFMSAVANVVKIVTDDDVKSIPWQWVLVIAKGFIPEMGTKSFAIMAAAGNARSARSRRRV